MSFKKLMTILLLSMLVIASHVFAHDPSKPAQPDQANPDASSHSMKIWVI